MKHVRGDLVKLAQSGKFDVIVHGCNCLHTMGAGVALQLARTFAGDNGPSEVDQRQTEYGDRDKLGEISIATGTDFFGDNFDIINGYTQYDTAHAGNESPVDYDAVRSVFRYVAGRVKHFNPDARIGYPAIGAGLAGGDWSIISAIIDEELDGLDHTYVEFETDIMRRDRYVRVARTLRDGIGADLFIEPNEIYLCENQEQQIIELIAAMLEAAEILEHAHER